MPTSYLRVAAIVLAAVVVAGCGQSCPPPNWIEKTIPVESLPDGADAAAGETTAELVSRCQASADQCGALCERAFGYPYSVYKTCELGSVDAGLAVHVVYNLGCPG